MELIEIARDFVDKGWPVFPLNGKLPFLPKDWRDHATTNIGMIGSWINTPGVTGLGVDLGKAGLTVVDVDNSGAKDGDLSLQTFLEDNFETELPKTFKVDTPSGGYHHYYKSEKMKNGKWLPDVDIKSAGGYVVIPGSLHPDGGTYELANNINPVAMPTWVSSTVGTATVKDEKADVPLVELDQDGNVLDALNYLKHTAEVSLEGAGGDENAYKVVCKLRDFGITGDAALKLLFDSDWNDRCQPPWGVDELNKVIGNAYRYAAGRQGQATEEGKAILRREEAIKVYGPPEGIESAEKIESLWVDISEYVNNPAPERAWFIRDWLPAGYAAPTLFTGDGGTGKSLLAMQLAIAISTGTKWLGLEVELKAQSLMIMCEDDTTELHRRTEAIKNASTYAYQDLAKAGVKFMSRVGKECTMCIEKDGLLIDGPFLKTVDDQLDILGDDDKLLFIDTAADVFSGNESNRSAVNQFVKNKLCALGERHNATIFLLAHPPKTPGATYSGSTAWNNSFRNRLFINWHEEGKKDDFRKLTREKSNYAKAGEALTLKYEAGAYIPVSETQIECVSEKAVFEAILIAEAEGNVLSGSPQARTRYIGTQRILDENGAKLLKAGIEKSVRSLIKSGHVEEVKGKKHGNGLVPVKSTYNPADGLEKEGEDK